MATRFAGVELSNYFGKPTDFNQIGDAGLVGNSLQRQTATMSEGLVSNAGMKSKGMIKSAGFQADAIEAEGQAAGQSAMASGLGNMVSGLAGGLSSLAG